MKRNWLGTFGFVAIFSLSCGVTTTDPIEAGSIALSSETQTETVSVASPEAAEASDSPVTNDPQVETLAAYLEAQRTGLTSPEIHELAVAITNEVTRHQLDLQLILALMYVESRYQPFVVSPVGAMGLMQILPATGEEVAGKLGIDWHGPETLFDPVANVRIGIAYVKELTNRYDKVTTALAAYNWGMGTIDKRLRKGTPVPVVYPGLIMNAYSRTVPAVRS